MIAMVDVQEDKINILIPEFVDHEISIAGKEDMKLFLHALHHHLGMDKAPTSVSLATVEMYDSVIDRTLPKGII
jgi:hypothetical protein